MAGGKADYLDILGLNYLSGQSVDLEGGTIPIGHHQNRPMHDLLQEIYARYGCPLVIAETGAEGTARPAWFYYVVREVLAAKLGGVNLQGVCLYPVTDYPGWENGRLCETGLLQAPDDEGRRPFFAPLLEELVSSADYLRTQLREWVPSADRVA